jgi:Ca2+-binding EF-hand superfamily protein
MIHILKRLTKAVKLEATETFNVVAEGESNFDVSRLPLALQSLDLSTKIDLSKLSEGCTSIDLNSFLQIVSVCIDDPDWSVTKIMESFAAFDREQSGIGEKKDINRVFMKLGEILTDKNIIRSLGHLISATRDKSRLRNSSYYVKIATKMILKLLMKAIVECRLTNRGLWMQHWAVTVILKIRTADLF